MTSSDLFSPTAPAIRPRRILALVFPHLSADLYRRRTKRAASGPLALHERIDNALRIAALDEEAAALGLYVGQPLAEARALFPGLVVAPLDRAADAADYRALLRALIRYSPLVGSGGEGAAFIDIEGAAHLFGGEAMLAGDAILRLRKKGVPARAAIAATPGCAFALAAFGRPGSCAIIPAGAERDALFGLPVAALRLEEKTVETLKSLGLKTIGAALAQPRKALAKRFGDQLLARIDAATGAAAEPISPIDPPPDFSADAVLAEPVMSVEAALEVAARLAAALADKLARAGLGARRFEFRLFRLDMTFEATAIALGAPTRAPAMVLRLLRLKLDAGERPVDPGFGFESFRLSAFETAPLAPAETSLLSAESGSAGLVKDRLANRLGAEVFQMSPRAAHVPERAEARARLLDLSAPWAEERADDRPPRPLLLLDPPEPIGATAPLPDGPPAAFRWRRQVCRVARAAGPERILGDWRRGEAFLRDYYRIEDEKGRRYWVFRRGLYEDGAEWFLHGFFA